METWRLATYCKYRTIYGQRCARGQLGEKQAGASGGEVVIGRKQERRAQSSSEGLESKSKAQIQKREEMKVAEEQAEEER